MQSHNAVPRYDSFPIPCFVCVCALVGDLNEETILTVSEEEDAHTKGLVIHLFMPN